MCSFVIHQPDRLHSNEIYIHFLSIGLCIAATEMGSLVIQDAALLEKCHHIFHEPNTISVLNHGSEIFRIVVGPTKL